MTYVHPQGKSRDRRIDSIETRTYGQILVRLPRFAVYSVPRQTGLCELSGYIPLYIFYRQFFCILIQL